MWGREVSTKHGVYTLCVSQHVCQCVKRENLLFFFSWSVSQRYLQGCCVLEGCGLRLAIRAKSSTNPVGRGPGLRYQKGDLEEKHQVKSHSNINAWDTRQSNIRSQPVINDKAELHQLGLIDLSNFRRIYLSILII